MMSSGSRDGDLLLGAPLGNQGTPNRHGKSDSTNVRVAGSGRQQRAGSAGASSRRTYRHTTGPAGASGAGPSRAPPAAAGGTGAGPGPSSSRQRPQPEVVDLVGLDSDDSDPEVEVLAFKPGAAAAGAAPSGARKRPREVMSAAQQLAGGGVALAGGGVAAGPPPLSWADPAPPPQPPSPEPAYKCPICLEAIEQMATTPCGHVFCFECLQAAIKAHKKCPKCRKNVQMRQIHKIYLN